MQISGAFECWMTERRVGQCTLMVNSASNLWTLQRSFTMVLLFEELPFRSHTDWNDLFLWRISIPICRLLSKGILAYGSRWSSDMKPSLGSQALKMEWPQNRRSRSCGSCWVLNVRSDFSEVIDSEESMSGRLWVPSKGCRINETWDSQIETLFQALFSSYSGGHRSNQFMNFKKVQISKILAGWSSAFRKSKFQRAEFFNWTSWKHPGLGRGWFVRIPNRSRMPY